MLIDSKKTLVIKIPKVLSVESVDKFHEELGALINQGPAMLELDCSRIDLVTSSHINLLWEARTLCLERGIKIKLCFVSSGLIRVLKVLDLHEIFLGDKNELPEDALHQDHMEFQAIGEFKLEFRAEANSITRALAEFRRYLSKLNLPMKGVIELEIVFYEVVTNIRLHSGVSSDATIMFNANSLKNKIVMVFTDQGKAFDPTSKEQNFDPDKAIKEKKKHGFGLTMITRMTNRMTYERRDDRINVLTLEKHWR
ncbi:MAG: ATP-binding protein [candidate division Zixibacteria bacterium]|nr:ATP-binding protein [candidate division Zixibacteria bacterium]